LPQYQYETHNSFPEFLYLKTALKNKSIRNKFMQPFKAYFIARNYAVQIYIIFPTSYFPRTLSSTTVTRKRTDVPPQSQYT